MSKMALTFFTRLAQPHTNVSAEILEEPVHRLLATGLSIAALLGVLDIAGLAGLFTESGPPVAVAIGRGALGILTLAAVLPAWRGSRTGVLTVIATRLLPALLSAPIFFGAGDAPGWAKIVVIVVDVLTVIGIALVLAGSRTHTTRQVEAGAS